MVEGLRNEWFLWTSSCYSVLDYRSREGKKQAISHLLLCSKDLLSCSSCTRHRIKTPGLGADSDLEDFSE